MDVLGAKELVTGYDFDAPRFTRILAIFLTCSRKFLLASTSSGLTYIPPFLYKYILGSFPWVSEPSDFAAITSLVHANLCYTVLLYQHLNSITANGLSTAAGGLAPLASRR